MKRGLGRPRKAVMEGRDPEEAPVAKRPPGRPRKAEAERSRPSSATLSGQRLSVQDPAAGTTIAQAADCLQEQGKQILSSAYHYNDIIVTTGYII